VSTDIRSKPLLPKEAREGVMRAWLEILRERHPGVLWVPAEQTRAETKSPQIAGLGGGAWKKKCANSENDG
jgi:hypothetical protein